MGPIPGMILFLLSWLCHKDVCLCDACRMGFWHKEVGCEACVWELPGDVGRAVLSEVLG